MDSEAENEEVSLTIEASEVAQDPGYVQIQEEAAAVDTNDVEISAANFPDEIFREYVKGFDDNKNGVLEAGELTETYINVDEKGIKNLKGIEFFKSITALMCSKNQLKSIDISGNPKLTSLYCDYNQLSSLDVSGNPELRVLHCQSNELSSLDVSKNPALTRLICDSNQLSSLDVSKNPALTDLWFQSNWLSSLDVSKNPALTVLYCFGNQLNSLDVSKNPALTDLECRYNQLKSLDVSGNPKLNILRCGSNQLSSLDLSKNPALTEVDLDTTLQVSAPVQADGVWQIDLANYIGSGNLGRVTIVSEGARLSGSKVLFGQVKPAQLVYKYDTKASASSEKAREMTVTMKFLCDVHQMTTRLVDKQPTCGTPGKQYRMCSVCGYREAPTEIPATGEHSFGDYVVTKPATLMETGVQTRTCTVCGTTEDQEIPKLPCNAHDMVTVVDQEATCGKAGQQHQRCKLCGYEEAPTEIPATGAHSFGSYVVTKPATAEEAGIQTRTCTVCGMTESVEIAAKVPVQAGQTVTKQQIENLLGGAKIASLKSGDETIVGIGQDGKLQAQKTAGTAVVTVSLADGNTKAIEVNVQKSKVKTTGISGLSKNLTLKKGKKAALKPVIAPVTSQDKVTYKSSNKKVAAVSAKGVIKGKKAGKAKITVTSGKKTVTVTVTVKK